MTWTQNYDPCNNLLVSALVAAVPIFFLFWALAVRKMKGYMACLLTVAIALVITVVAYRMPAKLALLSTLNGALYGLLPICWIIITAVFLYNVTVKSGQFEIIKNFMASITNDRRLQALLIAFSFGSFLEGTAGMGTPVAITAGLMVGLGFDPLYAAGLSLIANTAPVAFGGVGVPIIMASGVSGIPEMAVSQMVGRTLPFLSVIVPFYLVVLMAGWKGAVEVLPAILVSGVSFALAQWFSSNYLNPMLPAVLAGLVSIICLIIWLKVWKPAKTWHFKNEPVQAINTQVKYTPGQILKAWAPFLILTVMIIAWGLQPVKDALNNAFDRHGLIKVEIPGLHNVIVSGNSGKPLAQVFTFNYLSASGTAILLSALISIPLVGLSFRTGAKLFLATLNTLKFPILTIASVVGFAFLANNSGMSITMANALASTGVLFPFFSPFLGWLGVFLTGSDTSSNSLFCKLQYVTAEKLGIDPVVAVAANASGGVTGKMISPQSIAVGAGAVGLVGKESDLFRFTVKHSFIMLIALGMLTTLQAYVIKWIVPTYKMLDGTQAAANPAAAAGRLYLVYLAAAVIVIVLAVVLSNTKKRTP